MLQCGAHWRNPLQFIEAQVQLHQSSHIKSVGRNTLVSKLVVGHPDILQLRETAQETLWQGINGVGVQIKLVQMFRESLWDLRSDNQNIIAGLEIILSLCKQIHTVTLVNLLPLMSSSVRDFSALSDVLMSVTALSWRYRIVRLSIPSKSAGITWATEETIIEVL